MVSPSGTEVVLFDRMATGTLAVNFTTTVFSDAAALYITDPTAVPPYTGTYRPEPGQLLSSFDGRERLGNLAAWIGDFPDADDTLSPPELPAVLYRLVADDYPRDARSRRYRQHDHRQRSDVSLLAMATMVYVIAWSGYGNGRKRPSTPPACSINALARQAKRSAPNTAPM